MPEATPPNGLSWWIVRHRAWVMLGWISLALALAPRASHIQQYLAVAPPAGASEAAVVDSVLGARFATVYVNYAVLIVGGGAAPTTAEGRALLDTLRDQIGRVPGVLRTLSYESPQDTLFFAPGQSVTFIVAGVDGLRATPEDVVARLRQLTSRLLPDLAQRFPGLTLRWTGRAALNADIRHASGTGAAIAERRALPLTLLVLVIAFGTLVAALVPVASGALVITIGLGLASVIGARWPLATLVQSFVSMIGLGLGIDYALLVVSRFRESLVAGLPPEAAAASAGRSAGRTIILSGAAVTVGFAALLAIPHPEFRAAAVGGLCAAIAAVLVSTSLIPALLSWLGPTINRGRLWPALRRSDAETGWYRWSHWVARHPLRVLAAAGIPVIALAWQGHRLRPGLPRGDAWLPVGMESTEALRELEAMGRDRVIQTIHVLVELPRGNDVLTPEGWSTVRGVRQRLLQDSRVATVYSFTAFATERPLSRLELFLTPRSTWRQYLTEDRLGVVLEVVPATSVDASGLVALVDRIRGLTPLAGPAATRIMVGGLPASRADYLRAVGGRLPLVITLVLVGTFVALAAGFRSLLVPLKAIALNLLAVGSGFGAVVLVFQDGYGLGLFGLREPMDYVFPVLPTIVFCTVFGLSMDYEIFLVSRVAEAVKSGRDDRNALIFALVSTGPLITSAAAIMVVVFGAFMLGDFILIKMLGLALAVAVFVDATLIRVAVGPALLTLAGWWNWWPGRRVVPDEGVAA